jgi:FkbM family methyltransferase
MIKIIKILIKKFSIFLSDILSSFNWGKDFLNNFINNSLRREYLVKHKDIDFKLSVPNGLCYWRAKTFSTKEPKTLEWIDEFEKKSIFWDIGCNIGLYSIYAAKKGYEVYGFEPSFFNLEIIARNINLNNLSNFSVLPIALSDTTKMSELRLTSSMWGSAHSTFDKNYGVDGNKINEEFIYKTIGFSMDEILKTLKIPSPDYIKIDVDGIEHLILKGGINALSTSKSILIENSKNFKEHNDGINKTLEELNFKLIDEHFLTEGYYNQIWKR